MEWEFDDWDDKFQTIRKTKKAIRQPAKKRTNPMVQTATDLDTTVNAIQARQGMTTCECVFSTNEDATQYTYKISKNAGWKVGDWAVVVPAHGNAGVVKIVKIHSVPRLEQQYRLAWLLMKIEDPYARQRSVTQREDDLRTNIINAEALRRAENLAKDLGLSEAQTLLPVIDTNVGELDESFGVE